MVKFCLTCRKIYPIIIKKCPICGNQNLLRFCPTCKKIVPDSALSCPFCGDIDETIIEIPKNMKGTNESDESTGTINVIAFSFPLIGLILYIIYNDSKPNRANEISKWAWYGLLTRLGLITLSLPFLLF